MLLDINHVLIIFMSGNIYENIIKNYVDYNGVNPSNHNLLYLSISNSACDPQTIIDNSIDISNEIKCSWHKASFENLQAYRSALDCKLDSFVIYMIVKQCSVPIKSVPVICTECKLISYVALLLRIVL